MPSKVDTFSRRLMVKFAASIQPPTTPSSMTNLNANNCSCHDTMRSNRIRYISGTRSYSKRRNINISVGLCNIWRRLVCGSSQPVKRVAVETKRRTWPLEKSVATWPAKHCVVWVAVVGAKPSSSGQLFNDKRPTREHSAVCTLTYLNCRD